MRVGAELGAGSGEQQKTCHVLMTDTPGWMRGDTTAYRIFLGARMHARQGYAQGRDICRETQQDPQDLMASRLSCFFFAR